MRQIRDVFYFDDHAEACKWAADHAWQQPRIWQADKGWIVQAGPSGNYAGPNDPTPRPWRGFQPCAE